MFWLRVNRLELAALVEALRAYGPARMGNHELFDRLMQELGQSQSTEPATGTQTECRTSTGSAE